MTLNEIMQMSQQFREESKSTTEEARIMRQIAEKQNLILNRLSEKLISIEGDVEYLKHQAELYEMVGRSVAHIEGTLRIILIAFGTITTFMLFIAGILIDHISRSL